MNNRRKYTQPLKRKSELRTDYALRLRLLKSKKPRLVVRKSLKNVLVQIVEYRPDGDKIIASAYTKELQKHYGWSHARRNIPAAYLTGYLLGLKAAQKKIKEAIADFGSQKVVARSLLFAVVKGAHDAGLQIPCDPESLPSEDRIKGKHIKNAPFDHVLQSIKTKVQSK